MATLGLVLAPIQVPPESPQETEAAIEVSVVEARRALPALDHGIAHDPYDVSLRLERLGILHVIGVEERPYLDEGDAEIERIRILSDQEDMALHATLTAYTGAYEVVRAKHANWPFHKLGHVKDGLGYLDLAVRARPDDPVIRFLRLTSCAPLPFFLGRGDTVQEDARALAALLVEGGSGLSEARRTEMIRFLLDRTDLEADLRLGLSSMDTAPVGGGP